MRALAFVASVIAATSCVSAQEPIGVREQAIIGGDADTTDVAVVALQRSDTGTLCSGVLIAPNVVLTAAHCLFGIPASVLQVLVGNDTTNPAQTVGVSSIVVYPTYADEATGLAGGVDLGAVYLAQPLSITPVPMDTTSTDAQLNDATVTLVGFGVRDPTNDSLAGVRESVVTSIDTVCSRILTLGNADANTCFGDSGGAVLLNGSLVATISSGSADCIAPSNVMRLGAHSTWLRAVVAGTAAASCTECVPPDPSCGAATETMAAVDAGESSGDSGQPVGDATVDSGATTDALDAPRHDGCSVSVDDRGPRRADTWAGATAVLALFAAAVVRTWAARWERLHGRPESRRLESSG
jgi:V8-like Glu-specific endopeptidase